MARPAYDAAKYTAMKHAMESQGALSAVAPHMAPVPTVGPGAHFNEPPAQQAAWNQLHILPTIQIENG